MTQTKQGISSIELGRRLEREAEHAPWGRIKHKLKTKAMMEAGCIKQLSGRVEIDEAPIWAASGAGGKRGRGAPGKTPFIAAVETRRERGQAGFGIKLRGRVEAFSRQGPVSPRSSVPGEKLHIPAATKS